MGVFDWIVNSISTIGKFSEAAENYYEPRLIKLGIGKDQIQRQSLEELEKSLKLIDESMANKESFGTVRLKVNAEGEVIIVASDEGVKIDIGPTLLKRKSIVLERIQQLKGAEEVGNLRGLIEENVEESKRAEIIERIEHAEQEASEWRQKVREVEEAQSREQIKVEAELARLEAEGSLFEKRARVWQTLLARESVATVVGSILLLLITIALLIAMFTGVEPTEIISNAFLVLLGYFFGQTVSRKTSKAGE